MDYKVYDLLGKERLKFTIVLVAFLLLISNLFFGTFILILTMPFFYMFIKRRYCRYFIEKRRRELDLQFRDCLYSLAASFSSGRHMRDAIKDAYDSLIELYGDNSYMAKELKSMIARIDLVSEDEVVVWHDFAQRSGSEDVYSFVGVYEACRDTGGNIVSAVNRAAIIITEKITIEHEISNQIVQKRYEGRIIGLMPFMMIIFLKIMSPDYIAVMYENFMGKLLMLTALCLIGFAIVLEEKITAIEV